MKLATEKRLIDANALGIGRCNPDLLPFGNRLYAAGWNGVVNIIDNAPTVDAVEVVRCEKCLFRSQHSDENGCYKCGGLQTEDGDLVMMVKPDFYCAYGERRINV